DLQQIIVMLKGLIAGVVHMWPLDLTGGPATAEEIKSAQDTGAGAAVGLVQALTSMEPKPRLFVVTPGIIDIANGRSTRDGSVLHASLIGTIRSIANELPEVRPVIVDVDPDGVSAEALADEIFLTDGETEIALRGASRYGCRLERISDKTISFRRKPWDLNTRKPAFRMTMTSPGVIDNLVLKEAADPEPKPGEALIEVHVVSLNFRD